MLMQVSNKKYIYFEIDDEDFDKIKGYKWSLNHDGYIARSRTKTKVDLLHRYILSLETHDGKMVDHKDGNPLNNKKDNLRICTHQQNTWNKKITNKNKSGYKGVSWYKNNKKWLASIRENGKPTYIGLFSDKVEAAQAYDKRATELFGEFAKLNFSVNDENHYSKVVLVTSRAKVDYDSVYNGVRKNTQSKHWSVYLGKEYIGLFVDEIIAAHAYNQVAKQKYGNEAKLNDIDTDIKIDYLQLIYKKPKTSKFQGVYFDKYWKAQYNKVYLGIFDSENEAAIARDKYVIENGLDINKLNFPIQSQENLQE